MLRRVYRIEVRNDKVVMRVYEDGRLIREKVLSENPETARKLSRLVEIAAHVLSELALQMYNSGFSGVRVKVGSHELKNLQ